MGLLLLLALLLAPLVVDFVVDCRAERAAQLHMRALRAARWGTPDPGQ